MSIEIIDLTPYAGLNLSLDSTFIENNESPDLRNVEYWQGYLRCARSFTQRTSTLSGNGRAVARLVNSNGDNLVVITDKNVYRVSQNSVNSVLTYNGSPWRHVGYIVSLDKLIFTDNENFPMKYDGSLNPPTPLVDCQSMNIKGKFVSEYFTHYMLGYTIESGYSNPWRLRWSNIADMDDWDSGTAGFLDLVETPGAITGMSVLQNKLVVFKTDSIWDVSYVGYPNMFIATPITTQIGCVAPASIVNAKGLVFFLGIDGVYVYDGNNVEKISGKVDSVFYDINKDKVYLSNAVFVDGLDEYWIALPSPSGQLSYFLRFNLKTKGWYKYIYSVGGYPATGNFTGFVTYVKRKTTRWSDLAGRSWTSLRGITWEQLSSDYPETVINCCYSLNPNECKLYEFSYINGTIDQWYVQTKDIAIPSKKLRVVSVSFDCVGDVWYEVSYSVDKGATWNILREDIVMSTTWTTVKISTNITCDTFRLKITDKALGYESNRSIKNVLVKYIVRDRHYA